MQGKVCLVTGATSGIGRATATALADKGAEVFIVCRNPDKGEQLKQDIIDQTGNQQVHTLIGDLAVQADIRRVAAEFLATGKPLHVLVNNAGVVNQTRTLTGDGYEEMFAVNHLAYFLLTDLLLERIKASAPARIVSVSSGAHKFVKGMKWDDIHYEKGYKTFTVYGQSKLANILWTRRLAQQLDGSGVTANCLHPGAVGTNLGSQNGWFGKIVMKLLSPFFRSPEKGAETSIWLATSDEVEGVTGGYFYNCKPLEPEAWAKDDKEAEKLWALSEEMVSISKPAV